MPALAVTGTLGSGKSLLLESLKESLLKRSYHAEIFSADDENGRLLREDSLVQREIASRLGEEYLDPNGIPDRFKLRETISKDRNARLTLESIMHPRLRNLWLPMASRHRDPAVSFFVAEIPLLYEKGLATHFDKVLVIACSDSIRKKRLRNRGSLTVEQSEILLSIQQSQDEKIALADHVFWNDGTAGSLQRQIDEFLVTLPRP